MEAVVFLHCRNNLKSYMKKVNDEHESLIVVNKNLDENIVVISSESWDSLQETIQVMSNPYLSNKMLKGMTNVK